MPPTLFRQATETGAGFVEPAEPAHPADSDELPPASLASSVPLFTRLLTEQPVEGNAPADSFDPTAPAGLPDLSLLSNAGLPDFRRHATTTEADLTHAQTAAGVLKAEIVPAHSEALPSSLSLLRHATTTDPHDSKKVNCTFVVHFNEFGFSEKKSDTSWHRNRSRLTHTICTGLF